MCLYNTYIYICICVCIHIYIYIFVLIFLRVLFTDLFIDYNFLFWMHALCIVVLSHASFAKLLRIH